MILINSSNNSLLILIIPINSWTIETQFKEFFSSRTCQCDINAKILLHFLDHRQIFFIIRFNEHTRQTVSSSPIDLWSRCYDDLGCVNNTEEWFDVVLRPLKEPPLPRHIIKTTFTLFTRGKVSVELEPLFPTTKHITGSSFDAAKPRTHILIHDFTSNGMTGWIKHAVKSLLKIEAGNVISVDWTGGAEPPYEIAVQNARIVALEVALLLENLSKQFSTLSPQMFYLIGQGLGAHVAGSAYVLYNRRRTIRDSPSVFRFNLTPSGTSGRRFMGLVESPGSTPSVFTSNVCHRRLGWTPKMRILST